MNKEISQGSDRLRDTLTRKQDVRLPLEPGAAAKQSNGLQQKDRPVIQGRRSDDPVLQELQGQPKLQGRELPNVTREARSGNSDVIDRQPVDQIRQRDMPGGQGRYPERMTGGEVAAQYEQLATIARTGRQAAAELAGVLAGER